MFDFLTPGLGSVLSGAMSAGGSLLGGMFGASGQQSVNAQNVAMMREQMQWQERMSNTAYQRGMADMKAAGLNPILAANLGGASTPGLPGMPNIGNGGALMGAGVSSAGQAAATAAQTKAVLTQADKDKSQVTLNDANTRNADASTQLMGENAQKAKAETAYTQSNTALNSVLQDKARQDTATSAANAAAALAAARNHDQQTHNGQLQAVIQVHDAATAYQRAQAERANAQRQTMFGPGHFGDILNTGTRATATAAQGGWGLYSDYIGKPFSNFVGGIIDKFRSGENPSRPSPVPTR